MDPIEHQHGLISTAQLGTSGLSPARRQQLIETGVLQHRGRGVWALAGWPNGWPQTLWQSVLQAGPAVVLFRRTAAAAWGMDGVARNHPIELALPPGHQSRVRAIRRVVTLRSVDVTVHDRLPVTTVPRTLADLGGAEPPSVVERALEWSLRNDLAGIAELEALTERLRTKGARTLRAVLVDRPPGAPPTESDAETLFVQLVRAVGLPEPARQFVVVLRGRRYRLDFAWPALRLAVEIDGTAVHGPEELFRDLRRQNQIVLDGWMILRFTWSMLIRGLRGVEDDLLAAWGIRGGLVPSQLRRRP